MEPVGVGIRKGEDGHAQLSPQPENQLSGQQVGVALALGRERRVLETEFVVLVSILMGDAHCLRVVVFFFL